MATPSGKRGTMGRRTILGTMLVVGAVAASTVAPTAARAETCVTLPGTTGATVTVGDQDVRVPSTSGVAACIQQGGLPGIPRVDSAGGAVSIVLGGGSSTAGYVAVRYTLDGNADELRVPIPGGGSGGEICLASVGENVRADCLVKVAVDDLPTPPPVPTTPPIPTAPPLPEEDPFCHRSTCIPYGGSVLQEPYDGIQALVAELRQDVQDIIDRIQLSGDPCRIVSPGLSCF